MSNTKYPRRSRFATLRGRQISNIKCPKGVGLVELVIVMGIAALILLSLSQVVFLSNEVSSRSENTATALRLAEEAMEAARVFRDRTDWPLNGLGSLVAGGLYHPKIVDNDWVLIAGEEAIGGGFTRSVKFERVYRDANDNIAASGAEDANSRKVTVVVSGAGPVKISEVKLVTYLMNWR